MKPWIAVTSALLAVGCGAEDAPPPADAPPPPAEAAFETTEIADGVYRFRFNRHNAIFVNTPEGVVAFDPISTEAAAHYVEEIRRVIPDAELAAIVYSHRDPDHATGANPYYQ